ncbi:hypothetical protein LKB41_003060 [Salmonella enterica]|nr:hypothetical protein [Salmonella enterica]ECJ5916844.1 hypothetical protein [Salmonella enterica subsp. salamae]HCM1831175.1 hypothetical protein [Salmonella enterica subsp. salamae serovar 48:z81:z39]HCM1884074.1 hypothetical protein [Salmonella enterica subsp. salamae serovar 60:z10:z39]EAX8553682.1 hypothetical protein [Salmonella enterica]
MTNPTIIRALPPDVNVVNRTIHPAYPLPAPCHRQHAGDRENMENDKSDERWAQIAQANTQGYVCHNTKKQWYGNH